MKRFTFSLESVLQERVREVEKTQKEMAPVVNKFNKTLNQELRVKQTLTGGMLPGLGISGDYLQQLGKVYQHLQTEKKQIEKELQKWQLILAQKIKDKKVMEIIKEKRFQAWKKDFNKKLERNNEELIVNFF